MAIYSATYPDIPSFNSYGWTLDDTDIFDSTWRYYKFFGVWKGSQMPLNGGAVPLQITSPFKMYPAYVHDYTYGFFNGYTWDLLPRMSNYNIDIGVVGWFKATGANKGAPTTATISKSFDDVDGLTFYLIPQQQSPGYSYSSIYVDGVEVFNSYTYDSSQYNYLYSLNVYKYTISSGGPATVKIRHTGSVTYGGLFATHIFGPWYE